MGNVQPKTIRDIHGVAAAVNLDRVQIKNAVTIMGSSLQFFSELQKDREIVSLAIDSDVWAFQYAHEDLRNDPAIVLQAVRKIPQTFGYAGDTIKHDVAFIRELIEVVPAHDLYAITEFLPPNVIDASMTEAIVRKSVQTGGCNRAFRTIPLQFWTKALALVAIKNGNHVGEYFQRQWGDDLEVFEAVLKHTPQDFIYMSDEFINVREHALMAVTAYAPSFKGMSETNRGDEEILFTAMNASPLEFEFASSTLKATREVALKAVKMYGYNYLRLPEEMKNDIQIAFAAVSWDPKIYRYLPFFIYEEAWVQIAALGFSTTQYDRACIITSNTAWFPLKIASLVASFNETDCFLLSSQIKWGEPVLKKMNVSEACHVLKLNSHGLHMATMLKRKIAGYLKVQSPFSKWVNEACAERGYTARDLLWSVKDH